MSRALQAAAIALLILLPAGVIFERIGERRNLHRFPQVGRSFDVGGRTMNIYCSGEGNPTIIFETFGHASGYSWIGVQPEVAKVTRACWFDRAGYGWSEPGPLPGTYRSDAADLHALLYAARLPPPYVFVGANAATLHMRLFNGLYPGEVGGVVMVNAFDVDGPQLAVPDAAKGPWDRHFGSFAPRIRTTACLAFPAMARVGVFRVAAIFSRPRATPSSGLTADEQAELDELSDNPTAARGGEACDREAGMEQVRAAGDFGDRPLMVLFSPDRSFPPAWNETQIEQVQPRIARLSSRGRFAVKDEITPETFVAAVRDIMGELAHENPVR